MSRETVPQLLDEVRSDVDRIADMVVHRIKYGSPPLLDPSEDLGLPSGLAMFFKGKRIERRRKFLGLEYREWVPK